MTHTSPLNMLVEQSMVLFSFNYKKMRRKYQLIAV